jgi:ElaB/YqjD/DUF883 family membrane-anchored ribosome-binding protein
MNESNVSEMVGGARRKVEEFVSGAKEQARVLKSKSLEDLWGGTVGYVKENPGKTILVSVALGVLLGSYLRRRD